MKTKEYNPGHYSLIESAIRYYTENFRSQPEIERVASHLKVSVPHFKRLFKEWVGIPPKQFLETITADRARQYLKRSKDLLDTVIETGLSGTSRLHDHMLTVYAVTPGEIKSGQFKKSFSYGSAPSPFGECIIFFNDRGICHLAFKDRPKSDIIALFNKRWNDADLQRDDKTAGVFINKIFADDSEEKIPVLLRGTNFQINVWKALIRIPPGRLLSYSDIAKTIDSPKAHRAVANAVARNPVAYLIPCHRVIRESGLIGGYYWGEHRKRAMIGWEMARAQNIESI